MLETLRWLALEVKYLDRARAVYVDRLGLPVRRRTADGIDLAIERGSVDLRLRTPGSTPRGGLHTHFALATPRDAYLAWWERLSAYYTLEEHRFDDSRSLYFHDPDDHCVEIGQIDDRSEDGGEPTVTGIFEVALEVLDLERATAFYRRLGFETVDRGEDRRRVRLAGPVALELWEPQLGLADARAGVHVSMGFDAPAPTAIATAVRDVACDVGRMDGEDGVRITDPDGHVLVIRTSDALDGTVG